MSISGGRVVQVRLSGGRSYPVILNCALERAGLVLKDLFSPGKIMVAGGARPLKLHGARLTAGLRRAGFKPVIAVLRDGERYKTLDAVAGLYRAAARAGVDRRTPVIAFGGGVPGDTAGFFAATYLRGLPLVQIPTTVLAMVDSSVGGKTGVDLPWGKNLAGAFHQPRAVLVDASVLGTLPVRQVRNGLAEVIKTAVIGDARLFALLERVLTRGVVPASADLRVFIERCVRFKAAVVSSDEQERSGLREILNFGHTAGHAAETLGGYRSLLHGEAVAAGMIVAARIAVRRGRMTSHDAGRLKAVLFRAGLAAALPRGMTARALWRVMLSDKKTRAGAVRMVIPRGIGRRPVVEAVSYDLFSEVCHE